MEREELIKRLMKLANDAQANQTRLSTRASIKIGIKWAKAEGLITRSSKELEDEVMNALVAEMRFYSQDAKEELLAQIEHEMRFGRCDKYAYQS